MLSINQNTWTDIRTVSADDATVAVAVLDAFQAKEYIQGQVAVELGTGVTSVTLTMYIQVEGEWVQAFDESDNLITRAFTVSRALVVPLLKSPTAWVVSGWAGAVADSTVRMLAVK